MIRRTPNLGTCRRRCQNCNLNGKLSFVGSNNNLLKNDPAIEQKYLISLIATPYHPDKLLQYKRSETSPVQSRNEFARSLESTLDFGEHNTCRINSMVSCNSNKFILCLPDLNSFSLHPEKEENPREVYVKTGHCENSSLKHCNLFIKQRKGCIQTNVPTGQRTLWRAQI